MHEQEPREDDVIPRSSSAMFPLLRLRYRTRPRCSRDDHKGKGEGRLRQLQER